MKSKSVIPALLLIAPLACADDATWNVNTDAAWADDASWDAAAPGATDATDSPDRALFGTVIKAARAVTVDANRNIGEIDFAGNSSAYTLGGGPLILSSGGAIRTSGGGSGHTDEVATPLTLANAAGQATGTGTLSSDSTTAGRVLRISGPVSGAASEGVSLLTLGGSNTGQNTISGVIADGTAGGALAVEKTGAGLWMLNAANTFSGGLTIRAGELRIANPGGAAAAGSGPIVLGGSAGDAAAVLRVDNSFSPEQPLTVAAGSSGMKTLTAGQVAGPGYKGPVTLEHDLTVALTTGGATHPNFTFAGAGTINLNQHTLTLSLAQGTAGNSNNATITVNKPVVGQGSVRISGGGLSSGARTVKLSAANAYTGGTVAGGTGSTGNLVVDVSGDQTEATGGWDIDVNNESATAATTVNLAAGSSLAVAFGKAVNLGGTTGHFGARTLNAAGSVANGGTLLVRRSSTVNVSGEWSQSGPATVSTWGGGLATLRIHPGGRFNYLSDKVFGLNTSTSNNTTATVAVSGGVFSAGAAIHNLTANRSPEDSAFSQLILEDGGALELSADVPQLLTTAGGNIRLLLGGGNDGGVINTNGHDAGIDQPVADAPGQAGKLTKRGAGTLSLSGAVSHSGATSVEQGTLSLKSPSLADSAAVSVAAGATLHLDFAGADTVAAVRLAGADLGPGVYDSTTHPGLLSGSGKLLVPGGDPFRDWISGFFPDETDPAVIGRGADPDGDGIPNAVEFLTGGAPDDAGDRGRLWVGLSGGRLVLSLAIRGWRTVFSGGPTPSATVEGVTLSIQGSTDLSSFDSPVSPVGFVQPPTWPAIPPAGYGYHSFGLDASEGLKNAGFLRVGAE